MSAVHHQRNSLGILRIMEMYLVKRPVKSAESHSPEQIKPLENNIMNGEKRSSIRPKSITFWLLLIVIIAGAVGSWMFKEYRAVKVKYLQIATSSPAIGQTVLPTQRMTFVAFFERQ